MQIAPRDPCPASVGSKVKLAMPIEERVLDIFSRILADFPTPQQTILPLLLLIVFTAWANEIFIDLESFFKPSISVPITLFAIFIILLLITNFSELKSEEKSDILKNKILKNIRCLICQGQSVYDSESEFASSIKLIVDRKINEGLKEKQIYQFLREKYGDWIVYDPQLNKNTYILWLLPLLLFLLGGAIMRSKIKI